MSWVVAESNIRSFPEEQPGVREVQTTHVDPVSYAVPVFLRETRVKS